MPSTKLIIITSEPISIRKIEGTCTNLIASSKIYKTKKQSTPNPYIRPMTIANELEASKLL